MGSLDVNDRLLERRIDPWPFRKCERLQVGIIAFIGSLSDLFLCDQTLATQQIWPG